MPEMPEMPETPEAVRSSLATGRMSPRQFRAALTAVPFTERDGWVDRVFGLGELPDDGAELPRGCVPYLPSPVDALLRLVDLAELTPDDVFIDIGSGLGRATALIHFLTGASAIGVEIQPELVQASRELAERLNAQRVSVVHGDAAELIRCLPSGTVFHLYCPFSGARLHQVLSELESIVRTRAIRVCSLDLPLSAASWLEPVSLSGDLAVYRSVRSIP